MRYHPWQHAHDLGLTIEFVPGLRPRATYAAGLVQIRAGLSQRERRSALAHELVHCERGDDGVACSRWHLQKLERQVHLTAAKRLITIDELADAVISEPDYASMSQKLWVDDYTFRLRLAYVTEDERAAIAHLCPDEWRIA
ncbi:helix-turn-helix DNA binding protein [Gordonia phage Kenna]|uniref:Helix-turn-helix DNA binding protein n=2 Tax=Getalongvirus kenna TaxID=2734201 RepID=A0A3S9UQ12_9CAUD|nr:metallo-protease [Gordonia phage Kenna]AZS12375.1 helix-turn-helix DNA binding protein [Gordonia phage Kenna]QCG77211.1 helix-turn-helix DNA binding protein [Gordonia phage Lutum]